MANVPKGEKVTKEFVIENNRFLLEWRAKDLSVIKKSLGCIGVIGNNFLKNYAVYINIKNQPIHFY